MPATTSIFFDSSHPGKDGKCGVSIRVTHKRKSRYFKTNTRLTPTDFEKVMGAKPREPFKELSFALRAKEARAQEIIQDLPLFTFEVFARRYVLDKTYEKTIDLAFAEYATELRKKGQIGTAVSYECAKKSFATFKEKMLFIDVTPGTLQQYENWMLDKGNSFTTISIYVRCLRCLFNNAIASGDLHKDYYPFGKRRYEVPSTANTKKSLTMQEIEAIFNYQAMPGSNTEKFLAYWKFSYLSNGCNLKDIALLKFSNFKGNFIEFHRSKTANTKRKVEQIRAVITDETKEIIEKFANKDNSADQYVFPVLQKGDSPEKIYQKVQQFVGLVNDHLKIVASHLGITKPVTSYAARHSFATTLMRSGFSVAMISKQLGHSNIKTTAAYLGSFEDETLIEASKALLNFKTAANKT